VTMRMPTLLRFREGCVNGEAIDARNLIAANNKLYGRVATFTILTEALGKGLSLKPRPLDPKVAEMAKQLFDLSDDK
jgi:hypothetical protein